MTTKDKPWVYIMSPYTKGDVAINVRTQLEAFRRLARLGVVPIAPLWSHFQHIYFPMPYEFWIEQDRQIIKRCDAGFRTESFHFETCYYESESPGADLEEAFFKELGKPVLYSYEMVEAWVNGEKNEMD